MSGFQVPYSSTPPSTPGKQSDNGNNIFSFGTSNPSTTPAGPPPSSSGSFTPAGPPPSSYMGSSAFSTANPVNPISFNQQSKFGQQQPNFSKSSFPESPRFLRSTADTDYQASRNGGFQDPTSYTEEDEGEEEEEDDDEDYQYPEEAERNQFEDSYGYGEPDAPAEEDEDMGDYDANNLDGSRSNGHYYEGSNSDLMLEPATGLGTSKNGFANSNGLFAESDKPPVYGKIARSLYSRMDAPAIDEKDDIILNTEKLITSLYEEESLGKAKGDYQFHQSLSHISEQLRKVWSEYDQEIALHHSEEYTAGIGPGYAASKFAKANFIANLALQLHHPSAGDTGAFEPAPKPLPQVVLEWMDDSHNPLPNQVQEAMFYKPSPSRHPQFWDVVRNGILRGQVRPVVDLLKTAEWTPSKVKMDGIRLSVQETGYTGLALANVQKVTDTVIQVLEQCPAFDGDWNVRGSEWTLFRLRASTALDDLKNFAEGRNRGEEEAENNDFGYTGDARPGNFSRTAKKAESQVPWDIYQNLVALYDLIVGESDAIIANSMDWCEAAMGLLVWWDYGKGDRRLALGRSRASKRSLTKDSDASIYLQKLRRAFDTATSKSTELAVNSTDEVEVALASLLEGNDEAVLGFLRGWSGPISSAVAEIATFGAWLPPAEAPSLMNMDLDQDDMDLLGINSSPSKTNSTKDLTLITYAKTLAQHDEFKASGLVSRYGWELCIAILGRLDSIPRSEEMVGDFLQRFPLDDSETVDKLWNLLNRIGMIRQAENTAELYANTLAEGSRKYGEALWYYALAHKDQKVKDVLDLLISFSLIQSTAYPPESELDDHLRRLISSPKYALSEISTMDIEAAVLLQKMLSGYATLRKFYVLRDDDLLASNRHQSIVSRKKEAVLALLAVITSSDDNIQGGLYDEERGAVVSVDFLLTLLGEAMVFVNQSDFIITVPQIDILLRAIEDLQTVGPRVYSACTEFLQTVIAAAPGLEGSSPANLLRKSTSNASGTSSFSLIGSSMLASQLKQSMGSSGVMVKGPIKRGWDWRQGISANTTGDDVLRILRLGLANSLAQAFLIEADGV